MTDPAPTKAEHYEIKQFEEEMIRDQSRGSSSNEYLPALMNPISCRNYPAFIPFHTAVVNCIAEDNWY
jgi:hypothetical protein